MNPRIQKLYKILEEEDLDGLILTNPSNISYLADFKSRDSYAVISRKENVYITDSRYTEEVKKYLSGFTLIKIERSVFKLIADTCANLKLKKIGFEERVLPFAEYNKIRESLSKNAELVPTHSLVEKLRQVKTAQEIAKLRKAAQITIEALQFIEGFIRPGQTEIEISAEIERFIRYQGASCASFDTIVGSGPNSSYPHHLTSARKVRKNEPVLVDMGVEYAGYKSDLTRVFFSGKIEYSEQKIYNIVLEAQKKAINAIKPGAVISEIDALARRYIAEKGYGGFFGHNLGHGVGLDIHEEPGISFKEKSKLAAGMVFTVEPGIYLAGKFGVRIEDMVLVTQKGVEVISGSLNK
ncbi:MAG: Xaa-Pro peptidase family protein [Candidatus Omnitrophica bacterium]|nr:Xaa-Pro peptidase family protein [Candidatus Omnitrophota bacterium]